MVMTSSSEIHKCTAPDVLRTCEDAFDRATTEETAGSTGLVIVRGDTLVIRLRTSEPNLDIEVSQPHSQAVISKGIAFWVERKSTDIKAREHPPPLVAVRDVQQLYGVDFEGDPSTPISGEETAQITRLIADGDLVPVGLNEPEF